MRPRPSDPKIPSRHERETPLSGTGWWIALLVPAVGGILFLTLTPASVPPDRVQDPLCLWCGAVELANVLRNVLLFLPMGIVLGRLLGKPLRVLGIALLLSAAIELAQTMLPGRNPLLIDWIANSAGGGLGGFLGVHLRTVLTPRGGRRRILRWVAMGGASAILVASAWALALDSPSRALGVGLAPAGPPSVRAAALAGETPVAITHAARLGPYLLERGPHPESQNLAWVLQRAARANPAASPATPIPELEVTFSPGAPVAEVEALLRIHSGVDGREALLLAVRRTELVLILPLRATSLRLDRPVLRWEGALDSYAPSDTLHVSFHAGRGRHWCLSLRGPEGTDAGVHCSRVPSATEGWSLLLYPSSFPPLALKGLTLLWMTLLSLPGGLWSRSPRELLAVVGLPAIVLVASPWIVAGLAPAPAAGWLGLCAGALGGYVWGGRLRQGRAESVVRNPRP